MKLILRKLLHEKTHFFWLDNTATIFTCPADLANKGLQGNDFFSHKKSFKQIIKKLIFNCICCFECGTCYAFF